MEKENSSAVPLNQDRKVTNEKPRLGKRLTEYFRDYCEGSSLIGFRYLGERRSREERILWSLIILLSTGLSSYYVLEIYKKYRENPFIVNLATRESPIFTIPFPAITVCPAVKTVRQLYNFTDTVNRLWDNEVITDDDLRYTQYYTLLCESIDESYNNMLHPNKTFTEDFFSSLEYLHPTVSDVFLTCVLMGKPIKCKNLFHPVVVDEGICFTFNMLNREDIYKANVHHYSNYLQDGGQTEWTVEKGYSESAGQSVYPNRALLSGADNALQIFLMQGKHETDYLCTKDTIGFSVLLHTPQNIPQLKKSYFSVPLDMSVQAIVKPRMMTTSKEVKNYEVKDRKCYFTDERFLKYFKVYTPENCQLECLTNQTLETCKCVNFFMPRESGTSICGNAMLKCMKEAELSMKVREIGHQLLEESTLTPDSCNCMPICTSLAYDVETTRAPFPWKKMFRAAKKLLTKMEPLDIENTMHFSVLSIYFGSDVFLQMERTELYGFFDLMSNIGGILGLFNGFALLSIIEIVYYITVRLWCNYQLNDDFLET